MFSPSQMGGTPRDAKIEVSSNKESITIDGIKMDKLKTPFPEDTNDVNEMRVNDAVSKHNRLINRYIDAKDMKFVEPAPGLNEMFSELDNDAKKNEWSEEKLQEEKANAICKEVPLHLSSKMREKLSIGTRKPTKEEEAIIKKWEDLATITDPTEFEQKSLAALTSMTADGKPPAPESMRLAAADLAETVVYMNMNKKGTKCELPDSANYPVADVIAFPSSSDMDKLTSGKLSAKEFVEGGYVISLEDSGGQSVKKDGGAASGGTEKINLSTFDPDTIKDDLKKILKNFDNFNGNIDSNKLTSANKNYELILDDMKTSKIISDDWEPTIGSASVDDWAKKQLINLEKKAKKKKGTAHESAINIFTSWAKDAALFAAIHNKTVKSQDYGNINVKTGSGAGMQVTDGVTSLSMMVPSLGWDIKEIKDLKYIPKPNGIHQGKLKHKE